MIGTRLRAIIIKELWAILRDPRARITLIAPPLMQLLIFGFATTLEVKNFSVGVLNRDGGYWSQEIIESVQGSPNVGQVISFESNAEAQAALNHQRVLAVLRFDPDFSEKIARGQTATVGALFDGRRSNAAQIAAGYIDTMVADAAANIAQQRTMPASTSITVNWFNPNLDYPWFTMPALISLIGAITTLSIVAQSVARERELGTFDQLMVSPLRIHEILAGKMVPPVLVGVSIATLYVVLFPFVFHVPLTGSLPLLYLGLIFYLLATTGIGMLVSVLAATQQQAFLGMFLVAVPTILLSGYASPVDNMPGWLQVVAHLDPTTYFLVISEGVFLKAMPAGDILDNTWPLALIAVATLSMSMLLFRSRME